MEVETVTPCTFMFIVPQMPLSEIDGMVNLISVRRAKERHQIFNVCWRHCSARCEIFVENQIFAWADLPVCSRLTNTAKWNLEKWTKETQKLMAPLEWRRNRNFEGSKSYRKNPMKPFGPVAPARTPAPPHASLHLNGGRRRPGLTQPHGEGHASLPPGSMLAEHGHAQGSSAPPPAWTRHSATP